MCYRFEKEAGETILKEKQGLCHFYLLGSGEEKGRGKCPGHCVKRGNASFA